jgi:glycosyltransferase involved in cell wall biosynthesis
MRLSAPNNLGAASRVNDAARLERVDVPLQVVGDGPLRGKVDDAASPGLVQLGWLSPAEVAEEMARSSFLILPSVWPENFPMVIAEAFCQGLPVIASRIGALA